PVHDLVLAHAATVPLHSALPEAAAAPRPAADTQPPPAAGLPTGRIPPGSVQPAAPALRRAVPLPAGAAGRRGVAAAARAGATRCACTLPAGAAGRGAL